MVKKFWRKAASPSCHPSRRRMGSTDFDPIQYMLPLAHVSQLPKWHLDLFSSICVHHCKVSMFFNGADNPKITPSPWGIKAPYNTRFYRPTQISPKRHLGRLSRFCRAHQSDQQTQTHRQTDHTTPLVEIGRYRLLSLRCSLKIDHCKLERDFLVVKCSVCVCVCVCMYVYACVCMCVHVDFLICFSTRNGK